MAEKNIIKSIEQEIKKIDSKKNKISFFVFDTKGAPNGSLAYIYETAYQLKILGYNVRLLHAEKEFIGVESWLGEKYASLPHYNIEKDNVEVSASDILIIPEICTSVMTQTKELPCKRVALLQNFSYLTEMLPMGVSWGDMKIRECITTTNQLSEYIKKVFPYVETKIVRPSIPDYFYTESKEPKKLIINVVSKNASEVNAILKPFYWRYPNYNWVAFREVKNLPREEFAKALKEGIATIWTDSLTNFGYSVLEAMACKNIVIGKVPENTLEWMEKDGSPADNGIWFYDTNSAQDLIAGVIQSFLTDTIPSTVYEEMKATSEMYKSEYQKRDIEEVYNNLMEERKKELQIALSVAKNNDEKTKE